jgi:hypothetical protein
MGENMEAKTIACAFTIAAVMVGYSILAISPKAARDIRLTDALPVHSEHLPEQFPQPPMVKNTIVSASTASGQLALHNGIMSPVIVPCFMH